MVITVLSDRITDSLIDEYNRICKSDSGICGSKLRFAHTELGKYLGEVISCDYPKTNKILLIVMMRAGLSFALGIADKLESIGKTVVITFINHENSIITNYNLEDFELTIICDAVIRSGKGVLKIAEQTQRNTIFATNVLDNTAIQKFSDYQVYTSRISDNSYVGTKQNTVIGGKGPDTGDRLFESDFFEMYRKGGE
jgi:uracil phosphoribosyltransferase